jgi:hypothetical protein
MVESPPWVRGSRCRQRTIVHPPRNRHRLNRLGTTSADGPIQPRGGDAGSRGLVSLPARWAAILSWPNR